MTTPITELGKRILEEGKAKDRTYLEARTDQTLEQLEACPDLITARTIISQAIGDGMAHAYHQTVEMTTLLSLERRANDAST